MSPVRQGELNFGSVICLTCQVHRLYRNRCLHAPSVKRVPVQCSAPVFLNCQARAESPETLKHSLPKLSTTTGHPDIATQCRFSSSFP